MPCGSAWGGAQAAAMVPRAERLASALRWVHPPESHQIESGAQGCVGAEFGPRDVAPLGEWMFHDRLLRRWYFALPCQRGKPGEQFDVERPRHREGAGKQHADRRRVSEQLGAALRIVDSEAQNQAGAARKNSPQVVAEVRS